MQIPKKRTQILTISESSKEDLDVVSEYSDELDVSPNKETSKTNSKKLESTARKEQIKKLEGELYSHIQDAIELEEESFQNSALTLEDLVIIYFALSVKKNIWQFLKI